MAPVHQVSKTGEWLDGAVGGRGVEEKGRKVMVFDSTKIRRELFKSYSKDYALNQTADATSVFHLLQTMLHECQEMTFGEPCKHEMAKTPCAMHSRFFINHIQTQVC